MIDDDGDHAEHADDAADIAQTRAELRELMRPRISVQDAITKARDLYVTAKAAKTGVTICCPGCGSRFRKRSYQQAFCSNKGPGNCKDLYWNTTDSTRLERAREFMC